MEAVEVTPSLEPKKHAWYAACFLVLLLSASSTFLKELLAHPGAAGNPIEIAESAAFALGHSLMTLVVLIFPLVILFLFDGWFARTIVGVILAVMTLTQAIELGPMIRHQLETVYRKRGAELGGAHSCLEVGKEGAVFGGGREQCRHGAA